MTPSAPESYILQASQNVDLLSCKSSVCFFPEVCIENLMLAQKKLGCQFGAKIGY